MPDGGSGGAVRIAVMGAGFVGVVTGACLARAGHHVVVVERDAARVATLRSGRAPFHEPDLDALVASGLASGLLTCTDDVSEVAGAQVVFVAVGTPPRADGSSDTSMVFDAAEAAAGHLEGGVLALRSTVPPGTNQALQARLDQAGRGVAVVSTPEFLAEGTAVQDFLHPARLVFGGRRDATEAVAGAFASIAPEAPRIHTDWATAELVKYGANTFLAARVSLINEFARLCDAFGGDVRTLARAVGLDDRVGARFLRAGVGYGGSCFPKDVQAIDAAARATGVALQQVPAVHGSNDRQWRYVLDRARDWLGGLDGKRVGVWGLSFKPDTDDVREAPALRLVAALAAEGATVQAHDPVARLPADAAAKQVATPLDAARGADLVLHATEWSAYRGLPWADVAGAMRRPRIYDLRNVLPHDALEAAGIDWRGVGVNPCGR